MSSHLRWLLIPALTLSLILIYESSQKLESHQQTVEFLPTFSETVPSNNRSDEHHPSPLDGVVRLLLPPDQANEYNKQHADFQFYVYDDLPAMYQWQYIAKCIEGRFLHWSHCTSKTDLSCLSNCDWASSVCTETHATSGLYSRRRFNRNADLLLAQVFQQYRGPLRTLDPNRASLFVVPYAA